MQVFRDVIVDVEIVLRHLAAHDVQSVVVGAADNASFENIVVCECEVPDRDRDFLALALRKDIIRSQKCKTVRADVLHRCFVALVGMLELYRAGVV